MTYETMIQWETLTEVYSRKERELIEFVRSKLEEGINSREVAFEISKRKQEIISLKNKADGIISREKRAIATKVYKDFFMFDDSEKDAINQIVISVVTGDLPFNDALSMKKNIEKIYVKIPDDPKVTR